MRCLTRPFPSSRLYLYTKRISQCVSWKQIQAIRKLRFCCPLECLAMLTKGKEEEFAQRNSRVRCSQRSHNTDISFFMGVDTSRSHHSARSTLPFLSQGFKAWDTKSSKHIFPRFISRVLRVLVISRAHFPTVQLLLNRNLLTRRHWTFCQLIMRC